MCKVESETQNDEKTETFKPRLAWRNIIAFVFLHYWALECVYELSYGLEKFPWYLFLYGEYF